MEFDNKNRTNEYKNILSYYWDKFQLIICLLLIPCDSFIILNFGCPENRLNKERIIDEHLFNLIFHDIQSIWILLQRDFNWHIAFLSLS